MISILCLHLQRTLSFWFHILISKTSLVYLLECYMPILHVVGCSCKECFQSPQSTHSKPVSFSSLSIFKNLLIFNVTFNLLHLIIHCVVITYFLARSFTRMYILTMVGSLMFYSQIYAKCLVHQTFNIHWKNEYDISFKI